MVGPKLSAHDKSIRYLTQQAMSALTSVASHTFMFSMFIRWFVTSLSAYLWSLLALIPVIFMARYIYGREPTWLCLGAPLRRQSVICYSDAM
jgi:cell division protein FtsW (lipid II flippase)